MARLGAELKETFRAAAPPDVVRARFADQDAIIACTDEVTQAEKLDGERIRFVLKEQRQGVHTFRPDYVVRYRVEGDELVWDTVQGNMENRGRARFVAAAGGTEIRFEQAIGFDMPVPGLVAKMLQPVVTRLVQPSIRQYVERMIAGLPR